MSDEFSQFDGIGIRNHLSNSDACRRIAEARENGFELFPPEVLSENYSTWLEQTSDFRERVRKEGIRASKLAMGHKRVAEYLPLIHQVDPKYLESVVRNGEIQSAAQHLGESRSSEFD